MNKIPNIGESVTKLDLGPEYINFNAIRNSPQSHDSATKMSQTFVKLTYVLRGVAFYQFSNKLNGMFSVLNSEDPNAFRDFHKKYISTKKFEDLQFLFDNYVSLVDEISTLIDRSSVITDRSKDSFNSFKSSKGSINGINAIFEVLLCATHAQNYILRDANEIEIDAKNPNVLGNDGKKRIKSPLSDFTKQEILTSLSKFFDTFPETISFLSPENAFSQFRNVSSELIKEGFTSSGAIMKAMAKHLDGDYYPKHVIDLEILKRLQTQLPDNVINLTTSRQVFADGSMQKQEQYKDYPVTHAAEKCITFAAYDLASEEMSLRSRFYQYCSEIYIADDKTKITALANIVGGVDKLEGVVYEYADREGLDKIKYANQINDFKKRNVNKLSHDSFFGDYLINVEDKKLLDITFAVFKDKNLTESLYGFAVSLNKKAEVYKDFVNSNNLLRYISGFTPETISVNPEGIIARIGSSDVEMKYQYLDKNSFIAATESFFETFGKEITVSKLKAILGKQHDLTFTSFGLNSAETIKEAILQGINGTIDLTRFSREKARKTSFWEEGGTSLKNLEVFLYEPNIPDLQAIPVQQKTHLVTQMRGIIDQITHRTRIDNPINYEKLEKTLAFEAFVNDLINELHSGVGIEKYCQDHSIADTSQVKTNSGKIVDLSPEAIQETIEELKTASKLTVMPGWIESVDAVCNRINEILSAKQLDIENPLSEVTGVEVKPAFEHVDYLGKNAPNLTELGAIRCSVSNVENEQLSGKNTLLEQFSEIITIATNGRAHKPHLKDLENVILLEKALIELTSPETDAELKQKFKSMVVEGTSKIRLSSGGEVNFDYRNIERVINKLKTDAPKYFGAKDFKHGCVRVCNDLFDKLCNRYAVSYAYILGNEDDFNFAGSNKEIVAVARLSEEKGGSLAEKMKEIREKVEVLKTDLEALPYNEKSQVILIANEDGHIIGVKMIDPPEKLVEMLDGYIRDDNKQYKDPTVLITSTIQAINRLKIDAAVEDLLSKEDGITGRNHFEVFVFEQKKGGDNVIRLKNAGNITTRDLKVAEEFGKILPEGLRVGNSKYPGCISLKGDLSDEFKNHLIAITNSRSNSIS